jgi:hypothetical protein
VFRKSQYSSITEEAPQEMLTRYGAVIATAAPGGG